MSRPSEPHTLLLWGNHWWTPGGAAPIDFADDREAVERLVAHFAMAPKPVRLRLIYQPETLASVVVACPNGNRWIVAQALAGEYPALIRPNHAWGHEPVLVAGEGFATVLHYETEPRLLALATGLARRGLAVDSAWPLTTYLQALPDEWTDSGACTVIAVSPERAFAFRHPAQGRREIKQWHGEDTPLALSRWLAGVLENDPAEPVLLLCAGLDVESINPLLIPERYPGFESLTLANALGQAALLPRYHPAQLLPREPIVTAQRLALAASIVLCLTAAGIGGAYARDCLAQRVAATRHASEVAALHTGIAHLRTNASEITSLRGRLAGSAPGLPLAAFLRQVATTIPRQAVLGSLRLDGRALVLEGWTAPGAAAGLEDWRAHLTPAGAAWTVSASTRPNGFFTLKGTFRL